MNRSNRNTTARFIGRQYMRLAGLSAARIAEPAASRPYTYIQGCLIDRTHVLYIRAEFCRAWCFAGKGKRRLTSDLCMRLHSQPDARLYILALNASCWCVPSQS